MEKVGRQWCEVIAITEPLDYHQVVGYTFKSLGLTLKRPGSLLVNRYHPQENVR